MPFILVNNKQVETRSISTGPPPPGGGNVLIWMDLVKDAPVAYK